MGEPGSNASLDIAYIVDVILQHSGKRREVHDSYDYEGPSSTSARTSSYLAGGDCTQVTLVWLWLQGPQNIMN
jgi:hypothetical protein